MPKKVYVKTATGGLATTPTGIALKRKKSIANNDYIRRREEQLHLCKKNYLYDFGNIYDDDINMFSRAK